MSFQDSQTAREGNELQGPAVRPKERAAQAAKEASSSPSVELLLFVCGYVVCSQEHFPKGLGTRHERVESGFRKASGAYL